MMRNAVVLGSMESWPFQAPLVKNQARARAETTEYPVSLPRTGAVLIIVDAPLMVEVVTALLCRLGFVDIDAAVDGSSALRMMRAKRYGVVLSGFNMQHFNG